MARIRSIKPEFPQSESMGRISREARLCFIMLWTIADDSGRLRGSSRMLASLLYPYDTDASRLIGKWLTELVSENCIVQYEVEGQHYIEICNWLLHQKIDHPSQSKFPEPPNIRESSRNLASESEKFALDQGSRIKDQGEDQGDKEAPQAAPDTPLEKPSRFTPPTYAEVQAYCIERGNAVDPGRFIDFYASKGWLVGKAKMKDWKAAVRNWEKPRDGEAPTRKRDPAAMFHLREDL